MSNRTENEALAQVISENIAPIMDAKVTKPNDEIYPFAVIPNGMKVQSLKLFIDEYATKPERRKGTAHIDRLTSFVELTNRFKDEDSVLFAYGKITEKSVTARLTSVLDYNQRSSVNTDARDGNHRIVYDFPISKEFQAWMELDGQGMGQSDFAFFLEDRIGDLVVPNDDDKAGLEGLKPEFADPIKMLELSRGMDIRSNEHVRKHVKTQTGEAQIQYTSEHNNGDGEALSVPNFFVLGIPVFEMGERVRVVVRLRYRIANQSVKWFYDLYRPDEVFDHAFDRACAEALEKTDLPLYIGRPEE